MPEQDYNQTLKNAGLKVTLPRINVLQILHGSDKKHLSAEEIYKALLEAEHDVGLATVYRVLTQLEHAELIERHNFDGGYAVFEISKKGHHDHIVCLKCGHVTEFYDESIEQRQEQLAKQHGFHLVHHTHAIYGECLNKNCKHRNNPG